MTKILCINIEHYYILYGTVLTRYVSNDIERMRGCIKQSKAFLRAFVDWYGALPI